MKTSVPNYKKLLLLLAIDLLVSLVLFAQNAPELAFKNPVLVKGTANLEGAVYRFADVATGIDAEVKLKKFSNKKILMITVDNNKVSWDQALQPEFGLPGSVPANQDWHIDFEMTFFKAGTNKKEKLKDMEFTALDIDGDGASISEYIIYEKAKSITYAPVTHLQSHAVGVLGQEATCGECHKSGELYTCTNCKGTGVNSADECGNCKGSGMLHKGCSHAYTGAAGTVVNGSTNNFANIDTLATQVMVMYKYENVSTIRFRYGARTASQSSEGAGVRIYSSWFREFNMHANATLPVRVSAFTASLQQEGVQLKWTGNEENFGHYVVQRSEDGKNFSDIALVFANNTGGPSAYTFLDKKTATRTGKMHYRLKLVDGTKEVSYTGMRSINITSTQPNLNLQVHPNPVFAYANLVLPQQWLQQQVVVQVYNLNGVLVRSLPAQKGAAIHDIELSGLVSGQYVIKASTTDKAIQQKIIKN